MNRCLLGASVGLWCAWGLAAAAAEATPTVRGVRLENRGAGRIDEGFVRDRIATRAGQALDRAAVSRDVRALLDTGWFTDAVAEARPSSNGVVVVFGLVNRWRLEGAPAFEGESRFSRRKLGNLVDLDPGDPIDEHVAGLKAAAIRAEYRKHDYYAVSVRPEVRPVNRAAGTAGLVFHIDEGVEARVKRVVFSGNAHVGTRDLLDAVKYPNWWNPFRYFHSVDHDATDLAAYRTGVRDVYLKRGYLDAVVREPRVETGAGRRGSVRIVIVEGAIYRVKGWSITGSTLFSAAELGRAVKLKPGAVAGLDAIDAAAQAIKDRYSAKGCLGTVVRPRLAPDTAAHTVTVEFAVAEGKPTHLRSVQIAGNEKTRDKVIRRELLVNPGDLYDEAKVRRSQRRIENLGYFARVDAFPQDTQVEAEKDLILEVEEKSTGQFMIGAGFSSIDKVLGFIELSQGNFDLRGWPYLTGGGQKLKLRAEVGSTRSSYDLSFTEPWFLDRRLSLGLDLFRQDVSYDEYDLTSTGFATTLGKSLGGANRADLRYQLRRDVISDVSDTNLYTVVDTGEEYSFAREEDSTDSSLRLTLGHDTRNNPILPTGGTRASVFGQVSGGPLGFDQELYRTGLTAMQYWSPWSGHTLQARLRYETVDAYGDTEEVSISQRLFLGGGRNLRGFKYRDVGPKAIRTDSDGTVSYRPIGGQSMAYANFEYSVRIVKGVRIAAFYDIGNVWTDPMEVDAGDLASSHGVGLRFDLPGFPIRLDRAWVLEADDEYTRDDAWVFWIGYDF
jgi:outer membrane protein insertion porin family